MSKEKLSFAITLSGTYWDKRPQFSIWLDHHVIVQSEIASTEPQIINFERELVEGAHSLKIRLENKADSDTVVVNGELAKDMLLNIDDITIDDISLGNLIWGAEYHLDQQHQYNDELINRLDGCINLGWNGTYVLNFISPYYIWLLENL